MTIRYLKLITTCELYIMQNGLIVGTRIIEDFDDLYIKELIPQDNDLYVVIW